MKRLIVVVFTLLLLLPACSNAGQSAPPPDDNPNVGKVKLTVDGVIFYNGAEVTLDELKAEFAKLAEVEGSVLYYRESPESEPHPIYEDVLTALMEAGLPLQFSETDFTR